MNTSRTLLLAVIASAIAAFFYFGGTQYLTLDMLKSQQAGIAAFRDQHAALAIVFYGLIYIAVTGLSLPGAAILTLAGGVRYSVCSGARSLCLSPRRLAQHWHF